MISGGKKMRRRLFLFFCGIMTLFLFGCKRIGLISPHFASVEVLDENNEFASGCTFSALYDGQNDSEFSVYLDNGVGETDESHIHPIFKLRPCKTYDLSSDRFVTEYANGTPADEVIQKFRIRVSKEGYETVEYTPTLRPNTVCYALDSIVLKKSDGTSGSEVK